MTEKVQKLSKQLTSEKAASEQLQKSSSNQMTQQTSENRKLLLEISKLKVRSVCNYMYGMASYTLAPSLHSATCMLYYIMLYTYRHNLLPAAVH